MAEVMGLLGAVAFVREESDEHDQADEERDRDEREHDGEPEEVHQLRHVTHGSAIDA